MLHPSQKSRVAAPDYEPLTRFHGGRPLRSEYGKIEYTRTSPQSAIQHASCSCGSSDFGLASVIRVTSPWRTNPGLSWKTPTRTNDPLLENAPLHPGPELCDSYQ